MDRISKEQEVPFLFFDLPEELRINVYEIVFAAALITHSIDACLHLHRLVRVYNPPSARHIPMTLIHTNRQMRDEARLILAASTIFTVPSYMNARAFSTLMQKFPAGISQHMTTLILEPGLTGWTRNRRRILSMAAAMPALREVVIADYLQIGETRERGLYVPQIKMHRFPCDEKDRQQFPDHEHWDLDSFKEGAQKLCKDPFINAQELKSQLAPEVKVKVRITMLRTSGCNCSSNWLCDILHGPNDEMLPCFGHTKKTFVSVTTDPAIEEL